MVSSQYSPIKNEKDHGRRKTFYANGILRSEGFSIEGRRDGDFHAFYPNGRRWWSAEFEDGWRNIGNDVLYDANGDVLQEATREDVDEAVQDWMNTKKVINQTCLA